MAEKVLAYKCKYCGGVSLDKEAIKAQEAFCLFNPYFECCDNCMNMSQAKSPLYEGISRTVNICLKPPENMNYNTHHQYGWCPNYQRNDKYKIDQ